MWSQLIHAAIDARKASFGLRVYRGLSATGHVVDEELSRSLLAALRHPSEPIELAVELEALLKQRGVFSKAAPTTPQRVTSSDVGFGEAAAASEPAATDGAVGAAVGAEGGASTTGASTEASSRQVVLVRLLSEAIEASKLEQATEMVRQLAESLLAPPEDLLLRLISALFTAEQPQHVLALVGHVRAVGGATPAVLVAALEGLACSKSAEGTAIQAMTPHHGPDYTRDLHPAPRYRRWPCYQSSARPATPSTPPF